MTEHIAQLPNAQPALRVMPMPADANQYGDIFGGWIMSQVDIAGATVAMRRARGRVATVSVNSFVFNQPVSVGDVVSFFAEVVETGRTSIKVSVEVLLARLKALQAKHGDRFAPRAGWDSPLLRADAVAIA